MKSVQKGLRDGDIEKDTYERLICADCQKNLQTENDPDVLGTIRRCPECGVEFKELRT